MLSQYRLLKPLHTGRSADKPQLWIAQKQQGNIHTDVHYSGAAGDTAQQVIKFISSSVGTIEQQLIQHEIQVMRALLPFNQQHYWMPLIAAGREQASFLLPGQVADYVIMPYFSQGSLAQAVINNSYSITQKGWLFLSLLQGIEALHQQGWLHLDLKPSNIFLNLKGMPVLADFALAQDKTSVMQKMPTRLINGTPRYMSPEQFLGQPVSPQTDFYALGLILYELLTCTSAYRASSYQHWAIQHCQQPVPLLAHHLAGFQQLIDGLLAKKQANRFSKVEQIKSYVRAAFELDR